jgi:hypothetical protein
VPTARVEIAIQTIDSFSPIIWQAGARTHCQLLGAQDLMPACWRRGTDSPHRLVLFNLSKIRFALLTRLHRATGSTLRNRPMGSAPSAARGVGGVAGHGVFYTLGRWSGFRSGQRGCRLAPVNEQHEGCAL